MMLLQDRALRKYMSLGIKSPHKFALNREQCRVCWNLVEGTVFEVGGTTRESHN